VKWSAGVTTGAIAVSPNELEIALGAADGTVMIFDVHGGSVLKWRRSGAPTECVSFAQRPCFGWWRWITLLELQHWNDGRRMLAIVHLDIDHHFCLSQ
jgi:hypothetical protein